MRGATFRHCFENLLLLGDCPLAAPAFLFSFSKSFSICFLGQTELEDLVSSDFDNSSLISGSESDPRNNTAPAAKRQRTKLGTENRKQSTLKTRAAKLFQLSQCPLIEANDELSDLKSENNRLSLERNNSSLATVQNSLPSLKRVSSGGSFAKPKREATVKEFSCNCLDGQRVYSKDEKCEIMSKFDFFHLPTFWNKQKILIGEIFLNIVYMSENCHYF